MAGVRYSARAGCCPSISSLGPLLESSQQAIQGILWTLSLRERRPEDEADYSSFSGAEAYSSCMKWCVMRKEGSDRHYVVAFHIHHNTYASEHLKWHIWYKRRYCFVAPFLVHVYPVCNLCPSGATFGLRISARCITNFSLFSVFSPSKNWSFATCALPPNVVCSDVDLSALNHIS
jgi:hypothetical protein